MAFNDYFERVKGERINFTNGFSTNLQQVLDDIDTNFQRILSAPFIQGDSGNSVVRETIDLYTSGETFSPFGKAFVKSLYNDDDLSTAIDGSSSFTFTDLTNYIDINLQDSDLTDGVYSCEYINPNPTDQDSPHITSVDCYMIENTISKTFVPIVFFVDIRIAVMQGNLEAWGEDFIDRSCVLYGACDDNEDWDIKRYQVMPTLYFDSNVQQWCWALNNMETGVTAQGIQGVQGPIIPLWVATGVRYSNLQDTSLISNVYLAEILSTNQEIDNPTIDDVRDGDMVCVWFATDTDLTSIPQSIDAPSLVNIHNFTIGLAKRYGDDVVAVKYNSDYDFGTITDDVVLRTQLDEVGCDLVDLVDLRGLYVAADGERLGQDPSSSAGIHLIHSTLENSIDILHITPTTYEFSLASNLDNEHSAISNNAPLLCMDYSGIRSIPVQSDNSKYCYSLSNDNSNGVCTEDLVDDKQYEEYRITLFNDDPGSRKRRGEVGLVINQNPYWDKREYGEYIFLGGDTNNGNDQLLPGRYTYGGAGYKFDEHSLIQIIKDKKDIENFDNFSVGDCDRDMWNSLFNYAPNQIENPLASYLNLSYRRHIGLSIPSNQHELAMCFTPKVEVINESSNRKWLRIYLPTVGYMRDATPKRYYDQTLPIDIPNTYNPTKTYTTPVDNEPNWRENGGLSIKEALSHPNIVAADSDLYNFYKDDPNELFLYDRVRFLVDETCGTNLPEQSFYLGKSAHGLKGNISNPSTPTTEAGWQGSSAFKILSGYKPLAITDEYTSHVESRHIEAPVRGTKYNDYFDILLYDDTTMTLPDEKFNNILVSDDINNIWRSYCYANARGGYNSLNNSSYFNILPLMKFRLEKPIDLDTGGLLDTYHLADELYLSSIVAKGIKKDTDVDYVDTDIEFCMLFADPQVFNNGTNAPNISNNRSIIKYNDSNLVNDGNYVSLKNYVGRGNYFSGIGSRTGRTASTTYPPFWPENIQAIKNTIALNFVVKVRQTINDWYIVSIKPSSNEKDNHAEYNLGHIDSTTYFYPDRWILSNDYISNGLHDDTNSNFYESFSWWILDDLWTNTSQSIYANKNTYYQNLGLDPYKMISKDRFYMTPNENTDGTQSAWGNDPKFEYNFNYEKYYDFYELEIGNTLFGTRPRRPQLQYLETDSFTLHDRLGNASVYNFKLNYLNKSQNWNSWNINDNGKIINSNKISAIGFTLLDLGELLSSSMSESISMSNRSLQISQNTSSDLNSVVTQLQEDNINVNINDDSVKTRPNEIR